MPLRTIAVLVSKKKFNIPQSNEKYTKPHISS